MSYSGFSDDNRTGFIPYLVSSVTIIIVTLICFFFKPVISYHSVSLIFLFTISVLPLFFKSGPVLLAAAISALFWNFLFIPPLYTFYIASLDDILTFFMYFIIAITTGILTSRIHKLNEKAKKILLSAESERLYETLFNSISHELKTPISTIMAASESLNDEKVLANPLTSRQLTEEIYVAAKRLNRLVANLLDMTRLQSGMLKLNLNWHDVNDLVNNALKTLKHEMSGHKIKVITNEDLPLVKIDFFLMEQALINILINIAYYTPTGTEIEISCYHDNDDLKIKIFDNGPGFPEGTLEKIFDKFYRGQSEKTGGTGLGLSIVKGFIDAHKGSITVRNRDTGGLEFLISLKITG
jgi:two-component system sensor histidine kinase KdpD